MLFDFTHEADVLLYICPHTAIMCPHTAQVMAFMLFNFAHEADVQCRQAASAPAEMPQIVYAY